MGQGSWVQVSKSCQIRSYPTSSKGARASDGGLTRGIKMRVQRVNLLLWRGRFNSSLRVLEPSDSLLPSSLRLVGNSSSPRTHYECRDHLNVHRFIVSLGHLPLRLWRLK
jgi:hypothetical protein